MAGENLQMSEGLTPSTLLEHEDLSCFPYLTSPDRTEVEEAVVWLANYTEDPSSDPDALELYPDVPLHQSEALGDLNAACLLDMEVFPISDQTPEVNPEHTHSIPTSPSIREHAFPLHHHPYVMLRPWSRAHTSPSPHFPHYLGIPPQNYTASQPYVNFHACDVHQPTPACVCNTSHVGFASHLPVLSPTPGYQHPSEALSFYRSQAWPGHNTFPKSSVAPETFRLWERFCETAKGFYSSSPDVEALACFFVYEIGSHHSGLQLNAAVNAAVQKWNNNPASEREIYYTTARMFIQHQEEEMRVFQHHVHTNTHRGHVMQHSLGTERSADQTPPSGDSEVTDRSEVKDRSENASQVTFHHATGREKVLKRAKRKPAPNKRIRQTPEVTTANQRLSTKPHQTVNDPIRDKRQNEPQMRLNRKLKQQTTRDQKPTADKHRPNTRKQRPNK